MEKETKVPDIKKKSLQTLTDTDILFLIESFVTKRNDYENIADLIRGDKDIISQMIDSDRVFGKVMDARNEILRISPYFLFSLLLRKAIREKREDPEFVEKTLDLLNEKEPLIPWNKKRLMDLFDDEHMFDYIANMLDQFTRSSSLYKINENDTVTHHYIVDMISDSLHSDNTEKFNIYCHIGDYTLFLTGMIPEYVEYRFEYKRRPVDKNYYVMFGKTYYSLASENSNARKASLSNTLAHLSDGFEVVMQLLSFMNSEYLYHQNSKFF